MHSSRLSFVGVVALLAAISNAVALKNPSDGTLENADKDSRARDIGYAPLGWNLCNDYIEVVTITKTVTFTKATTTIPEWCTSTPVFHLPPTTSDKHAIPYTKPAEPTKEQATPTKDHFMPTLNLSVPPPKVGKPPVYLPSNSPDTPSGSTQSSSITHGKPETGPDKPTHQQSTVSSTVTAHLLVTSKISTTTTASTTTPEKIITSKPHGKSKSSSKHSTKSFFSSTSSATHHMAPNGANTQRPKTHFVGAVVMLVYLMRSL